MNETDPEKRLMPEDMPVVEFPPVTDEPATEPATPDDAARIVVLEAEIARFKDHMLRAMAETDNLRKRSQKEREDAGKYAVSSFAKDMIEIADNFQRAIDAVLTHPL